MRERLQFVSGVVKLTSLEARGTSLEITVPLATEFPANPASSFVREVDTL
jgi:hypothetical protein